MSIPVFLQIPIQTRDGNAWLYRRAIKLPILFIGMSLTGWGLPRLMGPHVDVCARIAEVTVNEQGCIYVTVFGTAEPAYTKEQVLAQLGSGWLLVPTPIPAPTPDDEFQIEPGLN